MQEGIYISTVWLEDECMRCGTALKKVPQIHCIQTCPFTASNKRHTFQSFLQPSAVQGKTLVSTVWFCATDHSGNIALLNKECLTVSYFYITIVSGEKHRDYVKC